MSDSEYSDSDEESVASTDSEISEGVAGDEEAESPIPDVIVAEERITDDYLTQLEYTQAINIRIGQLEAGSPAYCDIVGLDNATDIAIKEFNERKNPLILCRKIGTRGGKTIVEQFAVREMLYKHNEV